MFLARELNLKTVLIFFPIQQKNGFAIRKLKFSWDYWAQSRTRTKIWVKLAVDNLIDLENLCEVEWENTVKSRCEMLIDSIQKKSECWKSAHLYKQYVPDKKKKKHFPNKD